MNSVPSLCIFCGAYKWGTVYLHCCRRVDCRLLAAHQWGQMSRAVQEKMFIAAAASDTSVRLAYELST